MVGFTPDVTVYKIKFDETTPWSGFEIRIEGCTVAEWNSMMTLGTSDTMAEAAVNNEKTMEFFASKILTWNLEIPSGNPIQPSVEAMSKLPQPLLVRIIARWQKAMTDVSDELGKGLMNGAISEEQSLGLGDQSQSLQNWPGQSGT